MADPGGLTTAWMLKKASVFHGTGAEVVSIGVGSVPDVLRTSVTSLGLADAGEHCLPVFHIVRARQAGVLNPDGDLSRVASACPAILNQWSAPSPADRAEAIGLTYRDRIGVRLRRADTDIVIQPGAAGDIP